jgi:glycosyltransferase involved in cell wall biosynthesis
MKILFLSRWFPFPPNNGSKIRVYQLLQSLSQSHEVTLLSFADASGSSGDLQQPKICSNIQVVPWKPYNSQSLKSRLGFLSRQPRSLVDTYSPKMEALIRSTLKECKFDLVIASQLSMASYFLCFRDIPALFEEMEFGVFYDQLSGRTNTSERIKAQMRWLKLQRYNSQLLNSFDAGTVASESEFQIIQKEFPAYQNKIEILPNGVDLRDYQDLMIDCKPGHIIFAGSFTYQANYQAMQWFVGEVFPLIREQYPDVRLIITGDHANLPLPSLDSIILAGYVNDIKSLVASCDVSIAPIWSGGGTRLKILEAMAVGTPVVATTKGAEGLAAENETHMLLADDPRTFAEQVIRLLLSRELRQHISSNALTLVKDRYDWQNIMPKFLRLVEKTAAG